ncbi:hypothetical protein [Mycoplasmopsis gallinarum]|uniref:hypothetical protein n=1 Tax=Mycoplasmopsis gallinarum TaxID=29557 RepID=UPI0007C4AA8E|nr:hypothetical protein [Mycoplasmopsis gallinarum]
MKIIIIYSLLLFICAILKILISWPIIKFFKKTKKEYALIRNKFKLYEWNDRFHAIRYLALVKKTGFSFKFIFLNLVELTLSILIMLIFIFWFMEYEMNLFISVISILGVLLFVEIYTTAILFMKITYIKISKSQLKKPWDYDLKIDYYNKLDELNVDKILFELEEEIKA